jgi:hypothetical protein
MRKSDDEFTFIARARPPDQPGAQPPARQRGGDVHMPPSPVWGVLAWLVVVAAVVALVYLGFWVWEQSAPGEVVVPNVVGVQLDAARALLANKQLAAEVGAFRSSDTVAKDHVVSVDPKAGKVVKQGRVVRLVVSTGKGWVTMPDLTEMPAEKAAAICEEDGLKATRRTDQYDQAPPGYVIGQTPEARSAVRVGTEVTLIVSRGPAPEMTLEPGHKYADVSVSLPPGGNRRHVEIVVVDDTGNNVAYSDWRQPGSAFAERVGGEGEAVEVRVYVDGELIKQQVLP